jgi:hypothetical protein
MYTRSKDTVDESSKQSMNDMLGWHMGTRAEFKDRHPDSLTTILSLPSILGLTVTWPVAHAVVAENSPLFNKGVNP